MPSRKKKKKAVATEQCQHKSASTLLTTQQSQEVLSTIWHSNGTNNMTELNILVVILLSIDGGTLESINVASLGHGARCIQQTSQYNKFYHCDHALDGKLFERNDAFNGGWVTAPSQGINASMTVQFAKTYIIDRVKLMQRLSHRNLARHVILTYKDGTMEKVKIIYKWYGGWVTAATQGINASMTVQFAKTYIIDRVKLMQRQSHLTLARCIELTYEDGSREKVKIVTKAVVWKLHDSMANISILNYNSFLLYMTFWPIIQQIKYYLKIGLRLICPKVHRFNKYYDISEVTSGGRTGIATLKLCHFSLFQ